ncbi:hypothetical protein [Arthrobacter sp. HLT1-21]
MTITAAGDMYLNSVCPSNEAAAELSEEVNGAIDVGTPLDIAAVNAKAAEARDAYRSTIDQLSSVDVLWPEIVVPDIEALVENIYGDVAATDQIAAAPNEEMFIPTWNAWIDPAAQATTAGTPQKIRAKLELPADAYASCEGR